MQAPRDENREPTLLGVDKITFTTPTTAAVDASTHEQLVQINSSNSTLPLPTGAATSAKQDTGNTSLSSIDSKLTDVATQTTLALIKAKTDNIDVALSTRTKPADAQHTIVDSGSINVGTVTTLPAITGTVTANAGTNLNTSALALDSTVAKDASFGTLTTARSTATDTTSVGVIPLLKEISYMEQNPASRAVTNAGTFAVQATLQTQTDTVMVGGVNIKEINAVTPLMGNGTTGTGSQRVTIASDNTPFPVKTDQTTHGTTDLVAADITKFGGTPVTLGLKTVNDSIPVVLASSSTITVTQTTGTNLHTVIDNSALTTSETVPSIIYNGKTTVTTAGTRVVLASSQAVKSVSIKALVTNTGIIYVGNSSVASTNGYQLYAGDEISLDITNLTTVNIDSSVNGEGVTYLGVN